jgi:hypothetical protein
MTAKRSRLLRVCAIIAALALLWAVILFATGGFAIDLGVFRLRSQNPRTAFLIAIVATIAAWVSAPQGQRTRAWIAEWDRLVTTLENWISVPATRSRHVANTVAAVTAAFVVALGIVKGAHVAGAADSYGYVSQAHLWVTGELRVDQPLIDDLPEGIAPEALAPLGYRLSQDRRALVPSYAPGLPMLMAVFERVGGNNAVFLVMPLLAGLGVWATYRLGTLLSGDFVGVLAALMMATSPAFVLQLTHAPMSDIPAMAWWATALVLVFRESRLSPFLAGLAAGAAILTRPNLVPLAIIPSAWLIWERATPRLLLFAAGAIPACLVVAYVNASLYGSPLESGYGPLAGSLYQWQYLWPNVVNHTGWAIDSQSPLVLVVIAAPILLWRVWSDDPRRRAIVVVFTAFIVAIYACYAVYMPLGVWWSLRLFLPAFPLVFVLIAAALVELGSRLPGHARWTAAATLVLVLVTYGLRYGRSNGAFDSQHDWRYAEVGRYIAQHMPERAAFLAMLHSGSARYYSGRLTVRYDLIPRERLDDVLEYLRRVGYSPFILLDEAEAPDFVARFAGTSHLGALDRPAVATVKGVKIYSSLP